MPIQVMALYIYFGVKIFIFQNRLKAKLGLRN